MDSARAVAPDLPELKLADARLLPPTDYARALDLLQAAVDAAPDNTVALAELASYLMRVGRMYEAANVARRVAEADPLSPIAASQLIMMLGYASQFDQARQELAKAQRLWAGTGALRDAQWAFYLRYGDPKTAKQYANFNNEDLDLYLATRADPSPANVERLGAHLRPFKYQTSPGSYGFAIQAFAEFKLLDDMYRWVDNTPTNVVAANSYLFFRPAFRAARSDPRFMPLAKRIGLTDYWRQSGHWPDFCSDPSLPYKCEEAAR